MPGERAANWLSGQGPSSTGEARSNPHGSTLESACKNARLRNEAKSDFEARRRPQRRQVAGLGSKAPVKCQPLTPPENRSVSEAGRCRRAGLRVRLERQAGAGFGVVAECDAEE